ncbi:MAG: GNAT family N-acetyltransferase [Verrucomicrobiota bacterium]
MSLSNNIPIPQGVAKIVSLAELKNREEWRQVFHDNVKDHRYYEIVEQTVLGGFEHHYLLLEDDSGKVRAIQPLFFVRQNLIEGVPGKIRTVVDLIRKKFPRFLTMRVLMVGDAAGAGELGTIDPNDESWVAAALEASLLPFARQNKASLIVLKDFPAAYRSTLANLCDHGYARVPSMPMTRVSLNYASFDEYLGTIGYMTRKGLRRKFRKADRSEKIDIEVVNDITPHVDEIYPLYLQVHERSPMKFETLTRDFFCEIGRQMPERARFFIWRQQGKIIAFTLCLIHGDTIYDECLGLDYNVALELHLYFYTLRDVISWAITEGLRQYCSGPLNYDPKLHLGHELAPLDLYVKHTQPLLNQIFRRIIKYLEPTRHDPVLKRFPNADQL